MAFGCKVKAEDLKSAIAALIESDSRMKAANADIEAARLKKNATLGNMLPTVELSGAYGSGDYDWQYPDYNGAPSVNNTNLSLSSYNGTARLVQPLTLFGAERTLYRRDRVVYQKSCVDGNIVKQDLILNGVTSYLRLKQGEKDVEYARASVDNIKKQTEMEDAKVTRGGGVSTDVLQSKAQLLHAQAQLTRAEGQLVGLKNGVERVFSRPAKSISELQKVDFIEGKAVPEDLKQAEEVAAKLSPQVRTAELAVQTAEVVLSYQRFQNMPTINGVIEADWMDNYSGIRAERTEYQAKIEVRYQFNLGMSSVNNTRAARRSLNSAREKVVDTRKQVLEQVRNAWQNLRTAKETAEILRKQEAIADEFLTLARKERTLGRRSLLDVLNGEVTLINARSEAASAEADIEVYTYQLLRAMGVLDIEPDKSAKKTGK